MRLGKDTVKINVDIDKGVKEYLSQVADELGLPLSILLRNLLLVSLHDLNIGKNTGLLDISIASYKLVFSKIPYIKDKFTYPDISLEDSTTITLTINKETKDTLDQYVQRLDIPIKKFVRNLIYSALDDYKVLQKTGLIRIAYTFKKYLMSYQEFEENENRPPDSGSN